MVGDDEWEERDEGGGSGGCSSSRQQRQQHSSFADFLPPTELAVLLYESRAGCSFVFHGRVYVKDDKYVAETQPTVTEGETIVVYLRLNEQRRPELEIEGLRPKFSKVRAREVAVKPWSLYHFEVEAAGDIGQREFSWFRLAINTVEGAPHRYEMGLTVEVGFGGLFWNHYMVEEAVVVKEAVVVEEAVVEEAAGADAGEEDRGAAARL